MARKLGAWAAGLGCFSVISLIVGAVALFIAADRADWVETEGEIVQAELTGCSRDRTTDDGRRRYRCRGRVLYEYEVAGTTHHFERTPRMGGGRSRSSARRRGEQRLHSRFPVGDTTALYYDPAAPERAGTGRGSGVLGWLCIGAGTLLGLFSLVFGGVHLVGRSGSPGES